MDERSASTTCFTFAFIVHRDRIDRRLHCWLNRRETLRDRLICPKRSCHTGVICCRALSKRTISTGFTGHRKDDWYGRSWDLSRREATLLGCEPGLALGYFKGVRPPRRAGRAGSAVNLVGAIDLNRRGGSGSSHGINHGATPTIPRREPPLPHFGASD